MIWVVRELRVYVKSRELFKMGSLRGKEAGEMCSVGFVLLRWGEGRERRGVVCSTCSSNLNAGEDPWMNGLE